MANSNHGYCPLHRIGYNRDLDATCPQCLMARIYPPVQLDYDTALGTPVDASGKPVDAAKLKDR